MKVGSKSNCWLCHSRSAQCFIEWSLPYSFVLRNKGILSSLFLSKTCESSRSGLAIFSRSHRSSLPIIIIGYQRDGVFVLVQGCGVGDVDRREVVQLSAKFFCPSVSSLRIWTVFVFLPPDHNGVVTLPSCSSSGIHCFPMVSLPLSFAVSCTS